jgi:hypothetical protein
MDINNNWKKIVEELQSTKRDGIDKLIKWLDSTDFKIAPASTKFHLSVPGGLIQHSLNVLKYSRLINKETNVKISEDSIIITATLHDVCKINYYKIGEVWDKEIKEKFNRWEKKKVYIVNDQFSFGHGEGSVIKILPYIKLNVDEIGAIRWHMGWSDPGVHFSYPSGFPYRETLDKNPLAKLLIIADQTAEFIESYGR